MNMKYTHPAIINEETEKEITLVVDAEYIVCPTCRGTGTHFRRDLNESHMLEILEEEGDEQDYFDGHYDQKCDECHGRNVVMEVNWDLFNQKYPEYAKMIEEYENDLYAHQAEVAEERRYLYGGC
jgi:hypothetical protein